MQKRGRWCATHVEIAWKIHQQKINKAFNPTSSLRAGHDASRLANPGLLGPGQLFGLSANSAAAGQADVRSGMHPPGQ